MAPKVLDTAEAKSAAVPLSTVFRADDADVVIRAAETLDFRAHKLILSLVSPIFKDLFTNPRPSTGTLLHVAVDESAETWENILRTIYPMMPHPTITDLNDLGPLLFAAKEYEMQPLIDVHKTGLENLAFIQEDPLRLYDIACACGLEDQAKYVARNSELLKVARRLDVEDIGWVSLGSYHNLVSFLAERDNEWHQTLSETSPDFDDCRCNAQLKGELYTKIKETLKRPYLQTEQLYIKALEDRLQYGQLLCCEAEKCSTAYSGMKAFIDCMVLEREKMYDNLMDGKQYVLLHPSTLPPKLSSSVSLFPGSLSMVGCPLTGPAS